MAIGWDVIVVGAGAAGAPLAIQLVATSGRFHFLAAGPDHRSDRISEAGRSPSRFRAPLARRQARPRPGRVSSRPGDRSSGCRRSLGRREHPSACCCAPRRPRLGRGRQRTGRAARLPDRLQMLEPMLSALDDARLDGHLISAGTDAQHATSTYRKGGPNRFATVIGPRALDFGADGAPIFPSHPHQGRTARYGAHGRRTAGRSLGPVRDWNEPPHSLGARA